MVPKKKFVLKLFTSADAQCYVWYLFRELTDSRSIEPKWKKGIDHENNYFLAFHCLC